MEKIRIQKSKGKAILPAVKVGPKHQVTIPKEIFERLHLEVGDLVEAGIQGGKIVLTPKQLTDKPPAPRLNKKERQTLTKAKEKIARIQADLVHSKGLNNEEVKAAVKVGLIDPEQSWWWHEDWQKGEREAEMDIDKGRYKEFDNVEDLIKDLHSK